MKVQVEELSPIERKLSIEVENQQVGKELDRAYSALGRQVKIPGFRPGKVPRRILEQRFKQQVEDDVMQGLVQRAFTEAVREHKVDAVANPQITNPSPIDPAQPFKFEARVEVKPRLEPKEYDGLELAKQDITVGDDKINERIERMRNTMGRLEPVEGRDVAQASDFAQIDFDAQIDGKEFPGSKAENITVEVVEGDLIRGNVKELEGTKVGETKEVDYTFPDDYEVEEVRGKTGKFKLSLKGLKRQVTPELNDEFAKEVGGGETLEELRNKVRSQLERSLKADAEQKERDQLIDKLLEKNAFEVPRAMVDRGVQLMLESAIRNMASQGLDPRQLNFDFQALREEIRPRAEKEVKGSLLLEAIAEKQGLQATDEDVEKKLEQLAEENSIALSQVRKQFRDPDSRESLALRIREEKTIEFLKSRAKY
ncbi:MAG: trigger factor [Myxococcaceae bacterium]